MTMKNAIHYRDERRKIEFNRVFTFDHLRADNASEKRVLTGYASLFDVETVIAGWYREVIRAGAFTKTLTEFDQVSLWNHDTGKPMGRRSMKTLSLSEDDKGLRYENELGNQTWALDAFESVQRGDVNGMSFGFRVIRANWPEDDDERLLPLREILEVVLYEVSPVTFPAYPQTNVETKSREDGYGISEDVAESIVFDARQRGWIGRDKTETTLEPGRNHLEAGAENERSETTSTPGGNHSEAGAEILSFSKAQERARLLTLRERKISGRRFSL